MDVGCPKCQTEYELDDARVTEEGVTVRCATCTHVFRVKKKQLVVTLPAAPLDGGAHSSELPPPPPSREWKIRTSKGTFPCRDLTMLQKWIIEGKVRRDDDISLTGETWKRLGDIPELATFFQVYEEAQAARLARVEPPPPPPPSAPPPPPASAQGYSTAIVAPPKKITDTWRGGSFSSPPPEPLVPRDVPPPPPPAEPRFEGRLDAPRAQTLRAPVAPPPAPAAPAAAPAKRGGSGKWMALVLLGITAGGAAGYYFGFYEPGRRLPWLDPEPTPVTTTPPPDVTPVPVAVVEVDAGVEEETDAGTEEVDAGQEELDAGAEDAGVEDAGVPDAGAPDAGATPKTYEYFMSQANRLRNRDKAEASLDLYEKAAELKPERVEPIAGRGLALLDMANPTAAIAEFNEALKRNRRYGPAVMGMAEAQRMAGNNDKAIEYYERYLEVLPNGEEAAVARNRIELLKR